MEKGGIMFSFKKGIIMGKMKEIDMTPISELSGKLLSVQMQIIKVEKDILSYDEIDASLVDLIGTIRELKQAEELLEYTIDMKRRVQDAW